MMDYKETMPSVLHGMDSPSRYVPQHRSGANGKFMLAVVVIISVLILYLR
jgi:hypothetical protein